MPAGKCRPLGVVAEILVVKLAWPMTMEADSPVEKGGVNSRTLLLTTSETQRFPFESNNRPSGKFKPLADVAGTRLSKST